MKYKRTKSGFYVIKLHRGDDPIKCLQEFAEIEKTAGLVCGIGALAWAEIGYFDIENKEYLRKRHEGNFELLSFNGNIAYRNVEPVIHIHVVLGRQDFSTVGGHLFAGEISITGEIAILPWDTDEIERVPDDFTGLALWDI